MTRQPVGHIDADQLTLGKHLKVRAQGVHLDVHAGPDYIGAWIDNGQSGQNSIGVFMRKGEQPYIQIWPGKDFGCSVPFAIGPMGLQVPHPGNRVTTLSLEQISEWFLGMNRSMPLAFSSTDAAEANAEKASDPPQSVEATIYVAGVTEGTGSAIAAQVDGLVKMLMALPMSERTSELMLLRSKIGQDLYDLLDLRLRRLEG